MVVSQQDKVMSSDFWQEQLDVLNHLQTYYARRAEKVNTIEARAVALQLERIQAVLQQLAEGTQVAKSYRQLEQILNALLFGLIR